MKIERLLAAAALFLLGAQATKATTPNFVTIAEIPTSSEQVVVVGENAQVKIVHAPAGSAISVSTNCPKNWNIKGSTVRQVGFAKPRGGVAMMADALGSRAVVNGKVYLLPTPMRGGLSMGADGVKLGGQKLEPIAGVDMPGHCGDGPDALEITVPDGYKGDLMLGVSGESNVSVDSWTGGKFECTLVSASTLSAGRLKSLSKAVLDQRGDGKAEVGEISAKVLVANVQGNGKILVKGGNADISNATVTGNGSIIMKGKFDNLKKAIENGQGTIEVSP